MADTLLEYRVLRETIVVTSAFTGEIDCGVVPLDQKWRVDQVTVGVFCPQNLNSSGLTGTQVLLYDQAQGATPAGRPTLPVDATQLQDVIGSPVSGFGGLFADFNDRNSPLTILGGDQLAIVFPLGLFTGLVIAVRVQHGVYQGTGAKPQPAAGLTPAPSIPAGI